MARTKVFFVINSMALGGAERQMAEVVRRLPRDRFEPVLCSLGPENAYPELLPAGEPRYVVTSKGLDAVREVEAAMHRERPDVVHSFMEYGNLVARLASRRLPGTVVVTSVRSRSMAFKYSLVEGLLSRWSDAVVVNSVGTARELQAIQFVPKAKIRVIGNILDLDRFRPATIMDRAAARSRLGLEGPTLLLPGRIGYAKNQLGLVAALWRLRTGGRLPAGTTLLLAGRVYNQDVGDLLPRLLDRMGLADVVRILGPVKSVESLYAACDWVLLPSLWEGLPNAALEAHACGRPVVLSADANVDGIVADGVSGFEHPTLSNEGLATALDRALHLSDAEREAMGRAGRERVVARFAPGRILSDIEALYDELLARRRANGAR